MLGRPIRTFVAVSMLAGLFYLACVHLILKKNLSRDWVLALISVGFVMRLVSFFSNPILEDDFYRYLWDGGVTASGHNPYQYIPDDVFYFHEPMAVPSELVTLADESGNVAVRVNHSDLGTIYPPVAQGAFATAYLISPWNTMAWRAVLFFCDVTVVFLLFRLLMNAGLSPQYLGIYLLNPLVIKETYNSLHMDLLVIPFLLFAILRITSNGHVRAGFAVAAAIGCKLWPLILVPTLYRHRPPSFKKLVMVTVCSAIVLILWAWPMLAAVQSGSSSGFFAYGDRWEMNDALFMVFDWIIQTVSGPLGASKNNTDWMVRVTIALLLIAWTLWHCRTESKTIPDLANRWVLIIGALFLLSPTQFPWYFIWVLPFLTLAPRYSFLVLTAMLPMYYLKFYYNAVGDVDFFHNRLVWLEYAPTFGLILWEFFQYRKTESAHHAKQS